MRPSEFLDLAAELAEESRPAACRSAISRAYYAVFNAAEEFLERMGFRSPKRDYHVVLQRRFLVSEDPKFERIGSDMGDLHDKRIRADYKMADKFSESQSTAREVVNEARRMIEIIDSCPIYGDRWKKTKNAIQRME